MTRVLIVSDIRLYREGLVRFLTRDGRLEAVGSAGEWRAAELAIADARPAVALVDLGMRDAGAAIRRLLNCFPDTKVVALGLSDNETEVLDWAEAGIAGYVCRDGTLEDLVGAVEAAIRDELPCSGRLAAALLQRVGALASRLATPTGAGQLTSREHEVLRCLDRGLTNKQISSRLFIEVATVKNHVHNILEKLGAQTRGEAAAKARKLGLSPSDRPEKASRRFCPSPSV
jgi:two-component system, NarL family, nitrate/nitrite response regulator NarL